MTRIPDQRPELRKTGWHCIAGDPAQPPDSYLGLGDFRIGLQLGNWEPGSIWERGCRRYRIIGDIGMPQSTEEIMA